MRLTKAKMRELSKRVAVLENKKESKAALEEILCFATMCYHAMVECKCTCENHIAERLEEYLARPGNCICRQFHNPPIIPCGCVSKEELNSIQGFSFLFDHTGGSLNYDWQWKRLVPGMFSFRCVQGIEFIDVLRRDNQIIKKGEGRVEILADIPYESLLARYGVSP